MVSQVKGIVNSLETVLEAIQISNGYQQDVQEVEDASDHFVDVKFSDLPLITIHEGGEEPDEKIGGSIVDYTMGITLRCYLEGDNGTSLEAVRLIKDDVKKAIYDNPTLGNSDVVLAKVMTIAPPLTWGEVGDPVVVDILLSVHFRRAF